MRLYMICVDASEQASLYAGACLACVPVPVPARVRAVSGRTVCTRPMTHASACASARLGRELAGSLLTAHDAGLLRAFGQAGQKSACGLGFPVCWLPLERPTAPYLI